MNFIKQLLLISICYCYSHSSQASWFFKPSDVNALHSKPADVKIYYGKDSQQYVDLRLPEGKGPFPVAIIIHGGCWVSSFASAQNTAAISDALRDQGIATWNIEYRREDQKGGGWPGTFQDIARAADYLPKIAKKYALNLNKVLVIGQSAGGHLALWLGGRKNLPTQSILFDKHPLPIHGIIVLGGVADLKAYRQLAVKVCDADVVGKLLGGEPRMIPHYKEASPIELLPLSISQFFFIGENDQSVPLATNLDYFKKARALGDEIKVIKIPYSGHHEYLVPNSVVWPSLIKTVKAITNNRR